MLVSVSERWAAFCLWSVLQPFWTSLTLKGEECCTYFCPLPPWLLGFSVFKVEGHMFWSEWYKTPRPQTLLVQATWTGSPGRPRGNLTYQILGTQTMSSEAVSGIQERIVGVTGSLFLLSLILNY